MGVWAHFNYSVHNKVFTTFDMCHPLWQPAQRNPLCNAWSQLTHFNRFLPVRNVDGYAHVVTSDNKSTDIRTEQTRLSTDANFSRMNEIVNCSKLLMTEPDCELQQTSDDWTRLWTDANFYDWTRLWTAANFSWLNQIVNCSELQQTSRDWIRSWTAVNCSKLLMTEPDCELHQTSHDWTRLWTAMNCSRLLVTEPDRELQWTAANFSWLNQIVNCSKLLMTEPDCELQWTAADFSWLNQIVNCSELQQTSHDWTRLWTAPNFSVMTEHNDTSGTQDTTSTWDGTHDLCKITSLGNVQVPLWQHHGRKCPLTDRGHRHRWANQRCLMNELHSRWAMKWPIRNSQ